MPESSGLQVSLGLSSARLVLEDLFNPKLLKRMSELDLIKVAEQERDGGLFEHLDSLFERADFEIPGAPDAVVWQGGRPDDSVTPVAHALTDKFALNGTLMATDVLGLPFLAVPMMAQYRHEQALAPLSWFGALPVTSIKWSTAGDAMVKDPSGELVVVAGKSGNAKLRTDAGVFCNVRPYGSVTCVRCMPCLPYSQDKKAFKVDPKTGVIHSEMNTPGIQMAYACRHFLKMVNETKATGRVAFKPTQAMEDGINSGLLSWLLQGTKFDIKKSYSVDGYVEHRERVDSIINLLPKDFKEGMENWSGDIYMYIADTNYGILLQDLIRKEPAIVLSTDLDGDRLTDLMADSPAALRLMGQTVLDHLGLDKDMEQVWEDMGYTMSDGRDMTSVMYRMDGDPIYEQTLGSADSMLARILAGDETVGGTKGPYNPRIHFVLIRDAYKAANPGNKKLHDWLDKQIAVFDEIYDAKPLYIEGYQKLKEAITPW